MSDKRGFKSDRRVLYSCKYQVVCFPKYRCKVLVGGMDKRTEIIYEVAKELAGEVLELEVMGERSLTPYIGNHKAV
jgi:putative transposase